jgi:Mg2+-importing ATPase
MIVFGLIGTAFDLVAFLILSGLFGTGEALFQTTWFVISLLPEIAVVLVLRTRAPAWSGRPASGRCPQPSASSPCRRPFS